MTPTKVLMVCLGNICRSPTAHGVLEQRLDAQGLSHLVVVDSAGTSGWHIGEPPDLRSQAAARQRGYELSQQRGRQVAATDFETFDYIFAMDQDNLRNLRALCPPTFKGHLGLLLEFGSASNKNVPDPYHGGPAGFDLVLDLIEEAIDGLLVHLKAK